MKQTKRNKNLNLVLIGSLAMRGFVDGARVNDVVEEISSCCKYYCCSHTVQAAQYITAEIIAAGRQLSYYEEPGRGSVAYVTTAGIPPHLVEVLNGLSTGSVVITARDVFSFVNEALRKHYGTSLWPGSYEEEEGVEEAVPVGNEVPVACLEEKPKVKVEVVRRSVEEENEIEEDDEEAVTEERKYLNRKSKQVLKSPAKHLWRDLVLDEVLNGRLMALQARYQSGVPQWVVDLMDAEDEYEREL
ncbi:hypothetical protein GCK32_008421 [Trichostrongylus colubriformis]|uniref:Uncharacterized protein n=1 Tax=Trichostrongylus colubriformis TaxID=6319 RepID=A0AAN8F5R9_TRICO